MTRLLRLAGLAAALVLLAAAGRDISLHAQDKSVRPGINKPFEKPDVAEYLQKFEGESREISAQRDKIVEACGLRPGMAVADIGAGTGLFTRLFAKKVGPEGKVYAVDIAPAFVAHVEKTARDAGLKNVTGIVGAAHSPELPTNSVDLVFICDTYHHFEFPQRMLAALHKALRPGGRLVLIDFIRIPGKSSEWILGHVRAGQEVFSKEVQEAGFRPVGGKDFLKENYLVIFERVDRPADKAPSPRP